MVFNKAKALQEAHNYVAQGKTSKAIKQYEWIAERDSSDLILLNVIGDLYAHEGDVTRALKYFYRLADAYTREGYKVKAIAIYKKISKIDRDKVEPLLRLAELNSAQGLAREVREYYKNAFEIFEKKGEKGKALEILHKLCELDPRNHGLRVKLAQFAEGAGQSRQAADAYLASSALARENGDLAASRSDLSKAADLAPDNPEVHLFRARQALLDQKPEEIRDILGSVAGLQSNPEAKRLLLESHLAAGDLDSARRLLLDVLQSNPSNFAPVEAFAAQSIEKGDCDAALEVLRGAAPVLIARRDTGPLVETLRKLWKSFPERIDVLEFVYQVAEKTAGEATIPEVLEALGNVHVQLDQVEEAEQVYARLVAREPENETYKGLLRKVLEKQGKEYVPLSQTPLMGSDAGLESEAEAARGGATSGLSADPEQAAIVKGAITNSDFFVRDGLTESAVEELEKVLRVYPEQSEIHKRILEVCREDLPGRAVQAAEVLARICSEQGDGSEAKRYHEEALELAQTAASIPTGSSPSSQDTGEPGPSPRTVEINLSLPAGNQEPMEEETELPPPQEMSLEFESPQKAGASSAGSGVLQEASNAGELSVPGPAQHVRSPENTPAFNFEESREEIEFYLRHGFYDEAQRAVAELERNYPGEEQVSEFRRRIDQQSQASSPSGELQAARAMDAQQTEQAEWDLPTSFSGAADAGGSVAGDQPVAGNGIAAGRDDGFENLADELASAVEDLHDPAAAPLASAAQPGADAVPASAVDASGELGSLLDELNDSDESSDEPADDEQTHYNLGVAFREMGLLDEAIGEFQKVVNGAGPKQFGPYFLQGCTLLASSFMEKEMPAIAAKWYLRALDAPGLNHEGMLALYYDLGIAFEKAGNTAAALEKFTEVYSQNIDYRDVAEKIRDLQQTSR